MRDGPAWPTIHPASPLKPKNTTPSPIPGSSTALHGRAPAGPPVPEGSQKSEAGCLGPRPIRAVPPLLVGDVEEPGSLQSLVQSLDFAPRHRELAVELARRFLSSQSSIHRASGEGTRPPHGQELRERFFDWLLERVTPQGVRNPNRSRFRSPSEAELRLMGLLDQYRAGGSRPRASDCPLVRAAQSIGS